MQYNLQGNRMSKKINHNNKHGAASFYMVAFSTLILLIVVISFATVIMSEITRTANDDLSQSAYDSALAGVEDAKLAFYSYQNCLGNGTTTAVEPNDDGEISCGEILYYASQDGCDMVAKILGRAIDENDGSVVIREVEGSNNNMQQAYTCVKFKTNLSDYLSAVSESEPIKVVRPRFEDGVAQNIKSVKISWYSNVNSERLGYLNPDSEGIFNSSGDGVPKPPVISLALVQTKGDFIIDDFERSGEGITDRGMLYLVPLEEGTELETDGEKNYEITSNNNIKSSAFVKSNDKLKNNKPYLIECGGNEGFLCSATIELPDPVGGSRLGDTFMFVISLPYGGPATDFRMEFFCGEEGGCGSSIEGNNEASDKVLLVDTQVLIDSTGRANDLYRRVEARLEAKSDTALSIMGPLQLTGGNGDGDDSDEDVLEKVMYSTKP